MSEGRGEGPQPENPATGGPAQDAGADRDGCPADLPPGRRTFLHRLSLGLGGLIGAVVTLPWVAVLLSPIRRDDPTVWRTVGRTDDFAVGETHKVTYLDAGPLPWAGFVARSAAWLRRDSDDRFTAFTSYCTHVGCPIRWEEGAGLFMCPCHGGAFYPDGSVAAGPPPRPLDRYPVRVQDHLVQIQVVGVQAGEE